MKHDSPSLFNKDIPYIFRDCRNEKHERCQGAALNDLGTYFGVKETAVVYCLCGCHDETGTRECHKENVEGR